MNDIKTLITRTINCSTLSKEEFVKLMAEDLSNAVIEYDNYWKPIYEEKSKKRAEESKAYFLKRATDFANKKWKTEKKRQAYIESEMSKFVAPKMWYSELSYFDFDVEPWTNSLSGNCCLHCDKVNTIQLERCYDTIKDNKYFKQALGWILEDHHNSRPQIKLILPIEVQEEFDNDGKKLAEDIARFYEGCTYFGD